MSNGYKEDVQKIFLISYKSDYSLFSLAMKDMCKYSKNIYRVRESKMFITLLKLS